MGRNRGNHSNKEKAEILNQFESRFGCKHSDLVEAYIHTQLALQNGEELRDVIKTTGETVKDTLAIFGYLAYAEQVKVTMEDVDEG